MPGCSSSAVSLSALVAVDRVTPTARTLERTRETAVADPGSTTARRPRARGSGHRGPLARKAAAERTGTPTARMRERTRSLE